MFRFGEPQMESDDNAAIERGQREGGKKTAEIKMAYRNGRRKSEPSSLFFFE